MTDEIGIRGLKENTSEVLRRVREEHATYDVTYRGKVVAKLVPVDDEEFDQEASDRLWARMDELAVEIGKKWPKGLSAADAIAQDRR